MAAILKQYVCARVTSREEQLEISCTAYWYEAVFKSAVADSAEIG